MAGRLERECRGRVLDGPRALLCQTRPLRAPISSMLRLLLTLRDKRLNRPSLSSGLANRSALFTSSQLRDDWEFPAMRTSDHEPRSFLPLSANLILPARNAACGSSPSGIHVPRSHSITVPPPYCPFGIVPSNAPYSMGWSSTSTASRFLAGSMLGPLGTAQLLSTPSSSRRKS